MKAIVIHAPKDLRLDDVEEGAVGPHDVRVRIAYGGICGSDLHYYNHGGFGVVRLKQPMVLGHEIAGTVMECGSDVGSLAVGQKVAVNPSLPCGTCIYCRQGRQNHCLDMRFYGSAMRFPHVHGGFRESLVCRASQAVPVPDDMPLTQAAFAEPLAVCIHAVGRAGSLLGKDVLVTGSGPIGVLLTAVARRAGARSIVVCDVLDVPLGYASMMGADQVIDLSAEPDGLSPFERDKGSFDVAFEASGNGAALLSALKCVRPRGILVCVGQGAEVSLQVSSIVGKEIDMRGAFRFHEEFETAVAFLAQNLVDVGGLLTSVVELAQMRDGFDLAADKARSMKVQLRFS